MKRLLVLFSPAVLLATMPLAGCSPPQNPIIGKWHAAGSARTVEFHEDGTFHADSGDGRYKFPDASHIILVPEAGDLFSSLKTIKIDNDTLVLTDTHAWRAKPKTEKLRRVDD